MLISPGGVATTSPGQEGGVHQYRPGGLDERQEHRGEATNTNFLITVDIIFLCISNYKLESCVKEELLYQYRNIFN